MRSSVRGESSIRVIDSRSLFMVAVIGKWIGARAYAGPWKASHRPASIISKVTLPQGPGSIHGDVLAFTCDGVDIHEGP